MVVLLNTNIPIGLVAFCVTYFYQSSCANPKAVVYALLVCAATLFLYNAQRLFKSIFSIQSSPVLDWVKFHRQRILMYSLVLLLITVYLFLILIRWQVEPLLCISLAGILGLWYVYPLVKIPLREIPGAKALVVACVWLLVVVIFPLSNEGLSACMSPMEFMSYYVFFLGMAIPFDIRDLKYDSMKLKTIPQLVGMRWAKYCCMLCVATFWLSTKSNDTFDFYFLGVTAILIGLIWGIKTNRPDWYYALIDLTIIPMVWFATQ